MRLFVTLIAMDMLLFGTAVLVFVRMYGSIVHQLGL